VNCLVQVHEPAVRKLVAIFINDSIAVHHPPHVVKEAAVCLTQLLQDEAPTVVKQAALSANPTLRVSLACFASQVRSHHTLPVVGLTPVGPRCVLAPSHPDASCSAGSQSPSQP
jgi:hypothetical protein